MSNATLIVFEKVFQNLYRFLAAFTILLDVKRHNSLVMVELINKNTVIVDLVSIHNSPKYN